MQPDADKPVLRAERLTKIYSAQPGIFRTGGKKILAVEGVSFSIGRGETLGLVGESGSGKTTTGYMTLLLTRPSSGTVFLEGTELTGLKSAELRKLRPKMQIIFQNPLLSFNPRKSMRYLLREAVQVSGEPSQQAADAWIEELLGSVGLSAELLDRRARELSGGQQQRMAIARALATNPVYLVLDEALSALDLLTQREILNLLAELQKQFRLAFLFISHDLRLTRRIAQRILVMYAGQIVEECPAGRLFARPLHPYSQFLTRHLTFVRKKFSSKDTGPEIFPPAPQLVDRRGCVYANRCPLAQKLCFEETPPLETAEAGHNVRCFFAGETAG